MREWGSHVPGLNIQKYWVPVTVRKFFGSTRLTILLCRLSKRSNRTTRDVAARRFAEDFFTSFPIRSSQVLLLFGVDFFSSFGLHPTPFSAFYIIFPTVIPPIVYCLDSHRNTEGNFILNLIILRFCASNSATLTHNGQADADLLLLGFLHRLNWSSDFVHMVFSQPPSLQVARHSGLEF